MNQEKIICPKCGREIKSDARFCIYCGTIIVANETNEKVARIVQKSIDDYHTGKVPLVEQTSGPTAIASNTGNRSFAFYVTYFLYLCLIIITGVIAYLTGVTSFDILLISSYPMTIIALSICFLYLYSIELIFMKCNKPWWGGLVPVYNLMILGDIAFHKKYIGLLCLVPVVGLLFLLVILYKIGEKFKYNGFLTALLSIVFVPIIGFSDHLYEGKVYVTSGDNKSLEKDYRRKKIFFTTLILLLICGCVLFVMGNMGKVRKTNKAINGAYYVMASKKTIKKVQEAVEANTITCDNINYNSNSGVYYIEYPDLGDSIYLPLYITRDSISAYVKIDNNKNPREYYISMTDGKYGFPETLGSEVSTKTVLEYTKLKVLPDKQICQIP